MSEQVYVTIVAAQFLVIIALVLALYFLAKQGGQNYPQDVKQVLGALAGLAVFFSLRTENKTDDAVVNGVLLPIFRGLGIDVQAPPATVAARIEGEVVATTAGPPPGA